MRKTFPGYYRPTEDEFFELWKNCLFVLDANVLLNLYRYSPETSEELIGILKEISDRLWVPHQAALEYQKNRLGVIGQQAAAYGEIQKQLRKTQDELQKALRSLVRPGRHPVIGMEPLLERIKNIFTEFEKVLNERKQKQLDLLDRDHIRDAITALFEGKVGSLYSSERIGEIYEEGKTRYDHEIPPGYRDVKDKEGMRRYGDLVLWFQVIDKAKETKKPIILVTDDRKEDWWLRVKGRTIGPQPELIEEILSKADVLFHMYQADPFMEHARKYLERRVKQEAIDEVRDVRQRDEEYTKAAQAEAFRLLSEKARRTLQQLTYPTEEMRRTLQQLTYPAEEMQKLWQQLTYPAEEMQRALQQLAYPTEEMRKLWQQLTYPTEEMRRTLQQLAYPTEEMRRTLQQLTYPTEEMWRALQQAAAFGISGETTAGATESDDISLDSEPEEEPDESDGQADTEDE